VEKIYQGNQSIPTIIWMEGSFLADPSIKQLREKLGLSNKQMAILITRRDN